MGAGQWRRLCPNAVVVSPRMSAYSEASKAVFAIFEDTTPLVEGLSIDEAFLDVGGLRRVSGTPMEIGARLRTRVRDEVGLPITVGVARTKFLAKVASRVAKPDGLLVVPPDGELAFLHPLPVERLWGVGAVTAGRLRDRGITTVGQVAQVGETALVAMVGQAAGRHLHALAHNRDPRPVLAVARDLLAAAMPTIRAQGLTLVGVTLANLDDDGAVQLTLPFDRRSQSALDAAVDGVHDRFGSAAITRAVLLGRAQGLQ